MVLKMMRPKMKKDELEADFFPIMQRNSTKCMEKHGTMAWDIRAREYYFKWAGQVARMTKLDPCRLTPRVLHFKNIQSIRDYACKHRGRQGHGRNLHIWRWEADIFDFGTNDLMRASIGNN